MTTYILTLVNGWTIVTSDVCVVHQLYEGNPVIEAKTPAKTYHIPTTSIVCVQEAEE